MDTLNELMLGGVCSQANLLEIAGTLISRRSLIRASCA